MKKFLLLFLVFAFNIQIVSAIPADTTGWVCNSSQLEVSATEVDLKSDLKNDYRLYEATIKNKSPYELDVQLPFNQNLYFAVNELLQSGLTIAELIDLPKQIAVDCYNEDVGTGKVATAHKGLINVLGTAGSVVAGVGMLGIYPQQKFEEYVSHKKIKKEYKKYSKQIISDFVLSPSSVQEVLMFVPIKGDACLIQSKVKDQSGEVYSEYHQI